MSDSPESLPNWGAYTAETPEDMLYLYGQAFDMMLKAKDLRERIALNKENYELTGREHFFPILATGAYVGQLLTNTVLHCRAKYYEAMADELLPGDM